MKNRAKKIKPVKAWAGVSGSLICRENLKKWGYDDEPQCPALFCRRVDAKVRFCRVVRVLITPITPKRKARKQA